MRPPSRMQIVFLFLTIVVVVAARHAREPDAEDYNTDDHVHHHHHHHGDRHGRQHHHHRRRHDATAEEFPPSVKISGNETLFARTEEDVHVSCSATGHPVPKITWQRLVGRMPPTNAPHSHDGSLHIRRAQVADSGVYECVGSNGVSPDASAQVEIRVQGPRSRRGGGLGKPVGRRRKNKNNGSKQQKKEKKQNKKDPKKPRSESKSAEIIQAATARPKRTTASPAVEQLDEFYPDDTAAQPEPANAQPAAQQHEEIYPDDTVAQPQQANTAAQLRRANAQSAAEQFKGPPFTNPYTLPRLPETLSEASTHSTEQTAAKPCLYPFDALVGLQAVSNSCTIQALVRYYRNMACWHAEISECYGRRDCENKEVRLIHEVLSNQTKGTMREYMNWWKYEEGAYQDYEEVISNSLIHLGRKSRDPVDDTTNALGGKFNLKARHFVKDGDEDGLLTHIPFQPVVDDLVNPRLDFTGPNALLEAVTRTEYFESDRFGDYLTKYLKRPKNTDTTYYNDHNIKLYMEGDGRTAAGTFVIPGIVIRTTFRFQPLDDSNLKRTLPVSFENGGRTWKLHSLIVDNEKKNHVYNMFLVWKGGAYECWKMSGNKDPVHCSGETEGECVKMDCSRNRVLFAGYVVRDPSMDL